MWFIGKKVSVYTAYWHKNGLDIYRLSGARVEKLASGDVADLQPIKGWGKKLLIVSHANSLHLRKRYPAIAEKDLEKAVANEIEELFPFSNPSFHCQIFEKERMYTLVDIWAWDAAEAERIKKVFNFSYAVPEELAYASTQPEIVLYGDQEFASIAAYGEGKFLGSTSFAGAATLEGLTLFVKGLGRYATALKTLKVYGPLLSDRAPENLEVLQEAKLEHPLCLDGVDRINLKEFRSQSIQLSTGLDIALRTAVYVVLAYAIGLFLTVRNYDAALDALSQKRAELTKGLAAAPKEIKKDHAQALPELEKKLQSRISPLAVMEVLAGSLPPRSFLSRLVVNERSAEAAISSKDPLDVINALSKAQGIKSVKLRGAPAKDGQSGAYTFLLEIGL